MTQVSTILLACFLGVAVNANSDSKSHRTVNGSPVNGGEYPSQLSLQFFNIHICGASILNEIWALTTATCVHEYPTSQLSLLAGTINLQNIGSATRHRVQETVKYENYNAEKFWVNDIALVKVSEPFILIGGNLKAIPLPAQDQGVPEGSKATIIGWGAANGEILSTLQKIEIEIAAMDRCNMTYSLITRPLDNTNICAGSVMDSKSICMLSLQLQQYHYCGASILNKNWGLTSAHCLTLTPKSKISVVSGTNDLDRGGTRHEITDIIIHESFNDNDAHRYDIAVFKVNPPFKLNKVNVKPVDLSTDLENLDVGSKATVVGWDSGDSGGPLLMNNTVTGLFSWTLYKLGCSTPKYPLVHTWISSYRDWIHKNTGV
ncbi:mite allergen Eur m 3-like isoform X2 [Periplaneta americana]|uniref:mite allergen Eur m 3-like isoform X2 n=1 Tax=Periplaneta americana TaxID=6978 RepID=UPI0037E80DB6